MVENTPAESTCVNCGHRIRFVAAPPDSLADWAYWYHPSSNKTWCFDPGDPEVELERRHLRAEPEGVE